MILKATCDCILNQLTILKKNSSCELILDYQNQCEVYFKTFLVFEICEKYPFPSLFIYLFIFNWKICLDVVLNVNTKEKCVLNVY